jgi:hypothetical protein
MQNARITGHGGFHTDFKGKPMSQAVCRRVGFPE